MSDQHDQSSQHDQGQQGQQGGGQSSYDQPGQGQSSGQWGQSGQSGQSSQGNQPQGGLLTEQRLDQRTIEQQFGAIVGQSQMGSSYAPGQVDWAREYFDQAEQTLRHARRVSELHTLGQMHARIVSDTTAAVIALIRQNPQILRS